MDKETIHLLAKAKIEDFRNNNNNLDKLAMAIREGRYFHLFNRWSGNYVASFYFHSSAKACVASHGFNEDVKFISCERSLP